METWDVSIECRAWALFVYGLVNVRLCTCGHGLILRWRSEKSYQHTLNSYGSDSKQCLDAKFANVSRELFIVYWISLALLNYIYYTFSKTNKFLIERKTWKYKIKYILIMSDAIDRAINKIDETNIRIRFRIQIAVIANIVNPMIRRPIVTLIIE